MKKRLTILLFLFVALSIKLIAQNTNVRRAEKLLNMVVTNQLDSAYDCLSINVQSMITRGTFNIQLKQLQTNYGNYCNHTEWKVQAVYNDSIYKCNVSFTNGILCFITSFDINGKANTLRFSPEDKTLTTETLPASVIEKSINIISEDYKLPATLTLPKNKQNVPVVILVHGSGPNDRNETVGKNYPFHDLAWNLADKGIAVLRYDKRTHVYAAKWLHANEEANLNHEVIDDVIAAINIIRKQPNIDSTRIFVLGHSLGAMVAPRIAQRAKNLKGIIMMAAPARSLEDIILEQIDYLYSLKDSTANNMLPMMKTMKQQMLNAKHIGDKNYNKTINLPLNMPYSYWLDLNQYNQVKTALKIRTPMLVMQGERDYQVRMTDFYLWEKYMKDKTNVTFKSYPGLNHLFMEGKGTKLSVPDEYFISKHIPAYVINDIASFVNQY